jgi:prepilin-type processing-associated H-X9-DG protein
MMRLRNSVFVFFVPVIALTIVIIIPIHRKVRMITGRVLCEHHLKGISNAVRFYAYDNYGQYPTPEQWCEIVLENGGFNEKAFWCRTEPKGTFSYAINKYLYQKEPNEISSETVLLFEADIGRNGIGGKEDLLPRHKEDGPLGCNITFVDGHLEFVTEDRIDDLQWTVEE